MNDYNLYKMYYSEDSIQIHSSKIKKGCLCLEKSIIEFAIKIDVADGNETYTFFMCYYLWPLGPGANQYYPISHDLKK